MSAELCRETQGEWYNKTAVYREEKEETNPAPRPLFSHAGWGLLHSLFGDTPHQYEPNATVAAGTPTSQPEWYVRNHRMFLPLGDGLMLVALEAFCVVPPGTRLFLRHDAVWCHAVYEWLSPRVFPSETATPPLLILSGTKETFPNVVTETSSSSRATLCVSGKHDMEDALRACEPDGSMVVVLEDDDTWEKVGCMVSCFRHVKVFRSVFVPRFLLWVGVGRVASSEESETPGVNWMSYVTHQTRFTTESPHAWTCKGEWVFPVAPLPSKRLQARVAAVLYGWEKKLFPPASTLAVKQAENIPASPVAVLPWPKEACLMTLTVTKEASLLVGESGRSGVFQSTLPRGTYMVLYTTNVLYVLDVEADTVYEGRRRYLCALLSHLVSPLVRCICCTQQPPATPNKLHVADSGSHCSVFVTYT